MTLPEPKPGLVLRYDYLWSNEAAVGRAQGKDRPACLLAATDSAVRPRYVVLLPITHREPMGGAIGIELPTRVKLALGLDDAPSWVIVSEHNVDEWPNGGLSLVPGEGDRFLPPGLFARIKAPFIELARQKKTGAVRR